MEYRAKGRYRGVAGGKSLAGEIMGLMSLHAGTMKRILSLGCVDKTPLSNEEIEIERGSHGGICTTKFRKNSNVCQKGHYKPYKGSCKKCYRIYNELRCKTKKEEKFVEPITYPFYGGQILT